MAVSVIIPAHNAAGTIAETLDSLLAQTHPHWQAIIIDDGSTDQTRRIAKSYAARDPRIRVVRGPKRGAGAARNRGIARTNYPWLLFLDSDDTIAPDMLHRMTDELAAHPTMDAVHCGWEFTDPEGASIGRGRCEEKSSDLFPLFADYCALAIHACVVRRTIIEMIDGFDESLRTSEDFDLWQRAARAGCHFIPVEATLARYRLRPRASWFDAMSFVKDALLVARRGHASNPDGLALAEFQLVAWAGAIAIARGEDRESLLTLIHPVQDLPLDPARLADTLFRAIPLSLCVPPEAWNRIWPDKEQAIIALLRGLEEHAGAPGLAAQAQRFLEQRIVPEFLKLGVEDVAMIGATAAMRIEVTRPIPDFFLPGIDRVVCDIQCEGSSLGTMMLPVCDGFMPAVVTADAISARHAWFLLRSLFEQQVYPTLEVRSDGNGWSIARNGLELASGPSEEVPPQGHMLHDRIGWTVFVQELMGLTEWGVESLYDAASAHPDELSAGAEVGDFLAIELSRPLPSMVRVEGGCLHVEARVGGSATLRTEMCATDGLVPAAALRAALLDQGKMELARAAVREAVLGVPTDEPTPLRKRLCAAADAKDALPPPAFTALGNQIDPDQIPLWANALKPLSSDRGTLLAIGLAPSAHIGVEGPRRSTLPAAATELILQAMEPGQAALKLGDGPVCGVLYLPELRPARTLAQSGTQEPASSEQAGGVIAYGRHHFEALFARNADPWNYTSPYEQTKYEQTLGMLPVDSHSRVLEIGCAEGHFTVQLAPHVESILAADISEIALERTAKRCSAFHNVSFSRINLATDPLSGTFDLIVCSEVLYYMGDRTALAAIGQKLASALRPGGALITAHANLVVDAPYETGFDWAMHYGAKTIGETLGAVHGLDFEQEFRTDLYRIQRFKRTDGEGSSEPREIVQGSYELPVQDVARHILWSGGSVTPVALQPATTSRLPILMYHRVAPEGSEALARWRVTPEQFDQQLAYLKGAGFSGTSLDEWLQARIAGTPLRGRRVLISFDDGYVDFAEHAMPALQRHGFSATIFLPTDLVGDCARWDSRYGEPQRLMDWSTARLLRDKGIIFGSHAASHVRLSDLDPVGIVAEALRSRISLHEQLDQWTGAIAYPFGAYDEAVMRLAAACGYSHGLTTRPDLSHLDESDLALSRIEVMGSHTLEQFIAALGSDV